MRSLLLGLDVSPATTRNWTDAELLAADFWAREGMTQGQIAKALGRSENAVNLKLIRLGIRRRHMRSQSRTINARFWRYVEKTDECWWWRGTKGSNGYGEFWALGRTVPAHRFSCELEFGPVPNGLLVCHKCDHPLCVRPDHFFLGTHTANIADRTVKERSARGEANGGGKKLTREQVLEIRARYVPRKVTRKMLADEYGVSVGLIEQIVARKVWAWL